MQPLRKIEHGNTTYLFDDTDIRNELENFHIRKSSEVANCVSQFDDNIRRSVNVMVHEAKQGKGSTLMNAPISDSEVQRTFEKGSNTPGPDNISANLIDFADREQMHRCLKLLWNKSWSSGCFIKSWKKENRVVLPKPGKEDYTECNSYRTIAITSCLGK